MSVYCVGPPHVEIYPGNDVSVNENGILELDCLATGRPEPTVTWMRSVVVVLVLFIFQFTL